MRQVEESFMFSLQITETKVIISIKPISVKTRNFSSAPVRQNFFAEFAIL